MMKKIMIVMAIMMMVSMPVRVEGKSAKAEVTLRFYLTAKDKYRYQVIVKGKGSLIDGRKEIREGTVEYSLSVGQEKRFKVRSDIGNEIAYIKYNGKKQEAKEEIEIKAVSEDRKLEVVFKEKEKIEEIKKEEEEGGAGIPDNTRKPDTEKGNASQKEEVKTGEITSKYGVMMIVAGMMIVTILKKKHINTEECD